MNNNSIAAVFAAKEKVNIGYIVAGYPSVDFTKSFLSNLDRTAIDILEIGIPTPILWRTESSSLRLLLPPLKQELPPIRSLTCSLR